MIVRVDYNGKQYEVSYNRYEELPDRIDVCFTNRYGPKQWRSIWRRGVEIEPTTPVASAVYAEALVQIEMIRQGGAS